jgi:arylsulfatase A-like enzyme
VYRAAILGGVAVGLADGIRAAAQARAPLLPFLACVVLTLGFDLIVAAAGGLLVALLLWLAAWGRAGRRGRIAAALGWLCAVAAPAGAAVAVVHATAARNNRFLAAGEVALASLVVAVAAALLGPCLGRLWGLLPGLRAKAEQPARPFRATAAGILVLAPLAALVVEAVVLLLVWRTRAPLPKRMLAERATWVALTVAVLPFLLALASARLPRLRWWIAALLSALLFVVPAAVLIKLRWVQDFQFMAWNQVLVVVGLLVATSGLTYWLLGRGLPRSWDRVVTLGLPCFALLAALTTSEYEPARKAAAARASLAGELIAQGQRLFDFDHDGYARLLGGGDCDDGDPGRNPGASDWPDDGVDQDCDGKDASAAALRSPPFQAVPEAVPAELKILFVTIDTLRADHVGAYGYRRPTTPNLDRLAKEGTVFLNGWAHAPSTRYSMPAIAASRWPSAIDWDESIWWPRIAPTQPLVAQVMKGLGYTTAAFYAYLYFNRSDQRGFERGVDYYDDSCGALHVNVNGPAESVGSSSRPMADKGIAFLRAHGQEKFFLWMHFYDPHLNFERHPEAPNFGSAQADLYDGEIWFADFHFGRVLDELRALGLWDKTAIIVVGDHGESLGEHGIVAHGYHLYTPHTKVPFVFRVPGLPAQRLRVPVGHVDLAPSMVNLARGAHVPSFLGRSLVDLLAGKPSEPAPGPVFQEVSYEGNVKRRALVTANHHLIWNWTPDNTTECYDIFHDPGEMKDLWGRIQGEPACSVLKEDLRNRVALLSLPPGYADKIAFGLPGQNPPPPAQPLDARLGEHLRVLGYDLEPQTLPRGETATLVTHFELGGRLEPGWKLFFHLDGPGGFRNLDHVPVEGAYPMERWRAGQRIRDRLSITFTQAMPPGAYTVFVGLFKGSARAPITPASSGDGRDRLRLATITVQ